MHTALFVSEIGEGLGHVAPLVSVARALEKEHGSSIRIVFAVKDPVAARAAFPDIAYPFLPAPVHARPVNVHSHSISYAEVLAAHGYANRRELAPMLAAWDDLFATVQPRVVVAEHSPTACLAARGRIPVVQLGTGHTMPPDTMPIFPALSRDSAPPVMQRNILETVNGLLAARGVDQLGALPEMLGTERRFIFSVPQLDPYAGLRREPLLGTYNSGVVRMPAPQERGVFLYAGAVPDELDGIVQAMGRTAANLSAYLGPYDSAAKQFLRLRGATIYDTPPPLQEILARTSVVVSHGGAGLAAAALIAGRPQVVLPIHSESERTAGQLEHLGVGLAIVDKAEKKLAPALDALLHVRRFAERAQELAGEIASLGLPQDAPTEVARSIAGLLGDKEAG